MISMTSLAENIGELKLKRKHMEKQIYTSLELNCRKVASTLIDPPTYNEGDIDMYSCPKPL